MPLLLTSCALTPTTPLLNSAPSTEVDVMVNGQCVRADEIHPLPKTAMVAGGDAGQDAAGAAADVYAYKDELKRAIILLTACASGSPPVTAPAPQVVVKPATTELPPTLLEKMFGKGKTK
jgi:hypothetical protein